MISADSELPYHRPPLSKAFLEDLTGTPQHIRPASFYDSNEIEVLLNTRAVRIDRSECRVDLAGGRSLAYDHLVLATGTSLRRLEMPGSDLPGIHYLHSAQDATRLRAALHCGEDVLIVGGGFIGLEVAATAANLGKAVTLVESGPRLLARAVTPETSEFLLNYHRSLGVNVMLSTGVERFMGSQRGVSAVCLKDPSKKVPADVVLVAIGASPNCDLAAHSGLAHPQRVMVNEFMETTDRRILACGDGITRVCSKFPGGVRIDSVQNATDQGRQAAETIVGRRKPLKLRPWFWSDQAEARLQIAGLIDSVDSTLLRGSVDDGKFSVLCFQRGTLTAVVSLNSARDHMAARRLLANECSLTKDMAEAPDFDLTKPIIGHIQGSSF